MATVGGLFVNLGLDSANFTKGLADARKQATGFSATMNKSLAGVQKSFEKTRRQMGNSIKQFFSLRNAAISLAGAGGLGLVIKRSIEAADSIAKVADSVGISTKALQEYRYAASLAGVEQEKIDKALGKFTKSLGEARAGTGTLITFLNKYDKTLLDNLKRAKSTEEGLDLIFKALDRTAGAADRTALAYAAFGRVGSEITVMTREGFAALEKTRKEAEKLGLVIDDSLLRNAEQANDQLDILGKVLKTRVTVAVIENAKEIAKLTRRLIDAIPAIIEVSAAFLDGVTALFDWAEHGRQAAKAVVYLSGHIQMLATTFAAVGKAMKTIFIEPFKHIEKLFSAFTADLAAFAKNPFGTNGFSNLQRAMEQGLGDSITKEIDRIRTSAGDMNLAIEEEMNSWIQKLDETSTKELPQLERSVRNVIPAIEDYGEASSIAMEEQAKAAKELKEQLKEQQKAFDKAADNIQDSFGDMFFNIVRHGKASFRDLTDSLKDMFARTVAEMASMALRNQVIVPVMTAVMGGGPTGASAAGGGGALSSISSLSNLGGLFGGGSFSGAINTFGANTFGTGFGADFVGPLAAGQGALTSASLTGIMGAAGIGSIGGGLLANMLGLKSTGGSIGGGLGAAIGMMTPLGPIGALIGGALGSVVGGLFGSTPHPEASFNSMFTGGGLGNLNLMSKHIDTSGAKGLADALGPVLSLLSASGFNLEGMNIAGGVRESGGFLRLTGGGGRGDILSGSEVSFSADDAEAGIGKFIQKLAEFTDVTNNNVVTALENMNMEGRDLAEILSDIEFAAAYDNLKFTEESLTEFEQALADLEAQFDTALETAKRLGLEEDKVTQARQDTINYLQSQFTTSIQDRILGILDPAALALRKLNEEFDEIRKNADALGVGMADVEIAYGLERQKIIEQYNQNIVEDTAAAMKEIQNSARQLRLGILVDKGIGGLSIENRLAEARRQFDDARTGFLSGTTDFNELQGTISTLLDASKSYYGFSEDFYKEQAGLLSFLEDIEKGTIAANDNTGALVDIGTQQLDLLRSINDSVSLTSGGGLTGLLGSFKDSQLLRPGESAGALDKINKLNQVQERLVRQAKTIAGFDFTSGNNLGTSFADAVRSGNASGSVFNSLISLLGGQTQKFASGGRSTGGLMLLGDGSGPELVASGTDARVFDANTTRRMMQPDNNDIVDAVNDNTMALQGQRAQQAQESGELLEQVQRMNKELKSLRRALERKA